MTDPTTPSTPEPASTPAVPDPAPAYTAPPTYAAAPVGVPVKQSLSLGAMITGLASFLLSWVAGIGLIPGIVGLILSLRARKTEPQAPQAFWIVGVISSGLAILIGLIVGIITIAAFVLPLIFFGAAVSTSGY